MKDALILILYHLKHMNLKASVNLITPFQLEKLNNNRLSYNSDRTGALSAFLDLALSNKVAVYELFIVLLIV